MRGKAGLFSRYQEFSPLIISGLSGWWDASDSATMFDAAAGGSVVVADGSVARLEDKSGNGRHFTQASASLRPVYKASTQNSLGVLRFDGSNDYMESIWLLTDVVQNTQGSVFVVASAASVATNSSLNYDNAAVLATSDGGQGFVELRSNDTARSYGYDSSFSYKSAQVSYAPSAWKVFGTVHTGSTLLFRLNNGSPASSSLSTRQSADSTVVLAANYFRATFFHGDIGEIITYNVALSAGDREAVESYLMDKWAIT